MGVHQAIDYESFPKQSEMVQVGSRVSVFFKYDTSHRIAGTVVRNDVEAPWIGIIRLDDGRHILMTECQYS